jgi:hypothetical protein
VPLLAMPSVYSSSSRVWSVIAVIAQSPLRERRGARAVLRMVARSQARAIFSRAVRSSARIGVYPVVIGGPTVRLADLVGTERGGAGSLELTAATAFTVRLRGWAAAPGRPPPAVWPRHRATGEVRNVRSIVCLASKMNVSVPSAFCVSTSGSWQHNTPRLVFWTVLSTPVSSFVRATTPWCRTTPVLSVVQVRSAGPRLLRWAAAISIPQI